MPAAAAVAQPGAVALIIAGNAGTTARTAGVTVALAVMLTAGAGNVGVTASTGGATEVFSSPADAEGTPDGSYAFWTVP